MKYIISSVLICFCTILGYSQSLAIYKEYLGLPTGEDLSGTTVDVYCDGDGDCYVLFIIENLTDETINMGLERHKIVEAEGSEDYLSFGMLIDPSESYSAGLVSPQNPFVPDLRVDLDTSSYGALYPYYKINTSIGCSQYRYYFTNEEGAAIDSVDVNFCSTLAIEEEAAYDISIYPNPAQNQITIEREEFGTEAQLLITDIAGKVVYKQLIQNQLKTTIDLSSLEKGMYSATLFDPLQNEQIFNTRLVLE